MRSGLIGVQVFVSCTSEVGNEARIVEEVCEAINRTYESGGCPIVFQVKYWRNKTGEMGFSPQQQIDDWIKDYDVYIGILRSRFGTPTGDVNPDTGRKYKSGTEKEFHDAYLRWSNDPNSIKLFFYFLQPTSNSDTSKEAEQLKRVLKFKEGIVNKGWINDATTDKFRTSVHEVLDTYGLNLWKEIGIEQKKEALQITVDTPPSIVAFRQNSLAGIEDTFTQLSHYIPRYIEPINNGEKKDSSIRPIDDENAPKQTLLTTIPSEKRIVLLADAGVGKSIELQQAALHFKRKDTPFIPVFKRLNIYKGGSIEDFLPKGWQGIEEKLLLVFLDGLDEVERIHFQTAIDSIQSFTESYPEIRVVVSARTNFYELPARHSMGTLLGFKPYKLNDIFIYQIKQYLEQVHEADGEAFIQEAFTNRYFDLISKPFFLEILIRHFLEAGNLNVSRASIFSEYLATKISLDKDHFKEFAQQTSKREELIAIMERLALVMESLGRNYISDEEIRQVISVQNYDDLKYITGLVKKQEGNKTEWSFEHNNLQEYLAAKALSVKPFETVKKFISFPPTYTNINPSWVNTLSFWISIADETEKNTLVSWLLQIDQEIIVRFERDRIPQDLRLQIFQEIYAFYRREDIWLRSNQFDAKQLAQFAQSEEMLQFLIEEVKAAVGKRTRLLNAISLIERMDFEEFTYTKYNEVIGLFTGLLQSEKEPYMIHEFLSALGYLRLEDEGKIEQLMNQYKGRTNQYIRTGMYQLLINSGLVDHYIGYFLEGFAVKSKREDEDRESVSLSSEGILLRNAMMKIRSSSSIIGAFEFFAQDKEGHYEHHYDWKEVLKDLIEKASIFYKEDHKIYNAVFIYLKSLARSYEDKTAKMVTPFFEETQTKQKAFFAIYQSTDFGVYEKENLLALLIDESILDAFLNKYIAAELIDEDITYIHNLLFYHLRNSENGLRLLDKLEIEVNKIARISLERPLLIDYETERLEREQRSFDLLFDAEALKQNVISVFKSFDKEEISSKEMQELNRKKYEERKFHPHSVTSILWNWTRNQTVKLHQITQWIDDKQNFEDYRVQQIYTEIKNKQRVNEEQKEFLNDWVNKTLPLLNRDRDIISNSKAIICWYFIKKFNFRIPQDKALDFTQFWEVEREQYGEHHSIINELEKLKLVDVSSLKRRVTANLQTELPSENIWKNNAMYALSKRLKTAYPFILRELENERKHDYIRSEVAKQFLEETKDDVSLFNVINKGGLTEFHWHVIRLIIHKTTCRDALVIYLKGIMNDVSQKTDVRVLASKTLMRLNNLEALEFYTQHLEERGVPDDDYGHSGIGLEGITDIQGLPILMKLLSISKQPAFKQDRFHALDDRVLGAISNIAIQSEENLMLVSNQMKAFIEANKERIENIEFLHFSIKNMEEKFYHTKAQTLTISEAIHLVDLL